MIYLAKTKDAIEIARIHKQEIKKGFLSSLPINFLEKLYISIIENDFCFVAKEGGSVVGFIAGTKNINKLYFYFLKKYFFYSLVILLPKIFSLRKITEIIFYPKSEDLSAELLTIAVKKEFRGHGLAKEMFKFFASEMKKRDVEAFKVLVGENLITAINFYEKSGFKFLREAEVHKGNKSRIYIYNL